GAILRGPRPRAGSAGLAHALATFRRELAKLRANERSEIHGSDPRALLADAEVAAAGALVARLAEALAPLGQMAAAETHPLSALAAAHREAIARLSRDAAGDSAAVAAPDGTALPPLFHAGARPR